MNYFKATFNVSFQVIYDITPAQVYRMEKMWRTILTFEVNLRAYTRTNVRSANNV